MLSKDEKEALTIVFTILIVMLIVFGLIFIFLKPLNGTSLPEIRATEEALGFEYGSPYVDGKEVFMITNVTPNGSMDNAGVEAEDIITNKRITQFFQEIYEHQGQEYSFTVNRDGSYIVITVDVPNYSTD